MHTLYLDIHLHIPWTYDDTETEYILEGEVIVTPTTDPSSAVTVGPGDLVTFPSGMSCTWDVKKVMPC